MGFDVVLYDKEGQQVDLLEISEILHNEIFNSNKLWLSYSELRRLSDYYLTDETLSGNRLKNLIADLNNYQKNISQEKLNEYQEFINKISKSDIDKVHIAGD